VLSGFSLTQAVRRAVLIKPDSTAVIDGERRFTWRHFEYRVARLAGAFVSLGIAPGDRIALLALNSHRSLECFYAAMHSGAIIVPLNHRLSPDEISAQVNDCSPRIVIVGSELLHLADQLTQQPSRADQGMIHCDDGPAPAGFHAYEHLIECHEAIEDAGRSGDDLACLLYTSGTTSAAKGVMLSHANFCANTASVVPELGMDETTVHLHHGPLFHVASAARLFSTTHVAGTHVFLPRFVASDVIAEITRTAVTHATFVPTMFRMLLDEPLLRTADLSSLRCVSYGSAAMPEPLLREFMAALPAVRLLQSYGMTELSPVVTILGWRDHLI
jgi:long-chain acyl-CoA synthetase